MTQQHPTALSVRVKRASEMTGFSEWFIRDAINRGQLPAIRVPSSNPKSDRVTILVEVEDLQAWLRSFKADAAS